MKKQIPQIDTKPFELFLDLDGVFAGFDEHFKRISGKWPHEFPTNRMWSIINAQHEFFYSLPIKDGGKELWEYCRQYDPRFLTGLPAKSGAKEEKIRWVADKFGDEWETIVVPKRLKQDYSAPGKVLIDDTITNINQWVSKGGYGVHYKGDPWEAIRELEELRISYNV